MQILMEQLLESVVVIANNHRDLISRRMALLNRLTDLIGADAWTWAWGRGSPTQDTVTPLAALDHGFSDLQRRHYMEWAMSDDCHLDYRPRVIPRINDQGQVTTRRCDAYSDQEWSKNPAKRKMLNRCGWEGWIHCVRHFTNETWSHMGFLRNVNRPDFSPQDAAIIDLSMARIQWLHASADETLPPETFANITLRQRDVMLMLLEGLSRKQIAHQMGISEDTVGDHIKAIYKHFDVRSATELAGRFLKNQ